jgi:hypothetical protein
MHDFYQTITWLDLTLRIYWGSPVTCVATQATLRYKQITVTLQLCLLCRDTLQAGSLKTNTHKSEKRILESGSSNIGNSRSGVTEHLKCYGSQEMVVGLSFSLDRTFSFVNVQPVPERLSLVNSFIELRVGSWLIVGIYSISIVVNHLQTLWRKRLSGNNIWLL